MSFLTDDILKGTDWRAIERAIARVMSHCGWISVRVIGRSGDAGGDILGVRKTGEKDLIFVVQAKAVTGGNYVGKQAIEEAIHALSVYGANVAVVATNGDFAKSAFLRRDKLKKAGFDVRLWNGNFMETLLSKWPEHHHEKIEGLRPYQDDIVKRCLRRYDDCERRCQFVVATGLGKTVIAADIVSRLFHRGLSKALVLCHQRDLALQLEQAFWRQITKQVPTRVFFDGSPPKPINGINFGLYQTLTTYLSGVDPEEYDVVVVDEAHHALACGFTRCISHLRPKFLIGMTATPWRGDGKTIASLFGPTIAQVSLVDGMQMGHLAKVDYRIYCDTIDWHDVARQAKSGLSIRDLNKRLFIPQRDEAIVAILADLLKNVAFPRVIVFCASIEHCKRFANLLTSITGIKCRALSGIEKGERQRIIMQFTSGQIAGVTAVDVLNEGIDVPEVNVIVFLRSTHSRRIFVQQLGRGLRVSEGKTSLVVADFVTDIRRLAAVLNMDSASRTPQSKYCTLSFPEGIVTIEEKGSLPFVRQWLQDVADVADADDSSTLKFPEVL